MANIKTGEKKEIARLHLTLPASLAEEFEELTAELNITKVAAARSALKEWVDRKTAERMAEGYSASAEENAKLMEDFKYVDSEGWE